MQSFLQLVAHDLYAKIGNEAVAFELREKDANGKLLYFSTFIKFEVPLTVSLTYAKLYAVQADGKRILLEE